MANEQKYPVTFQEQDVISGQRMRFVRSTKLRIILALWLGAVGLVVLQTLLPQVLPFGQFLTLPMAGNLSVVFVAVLVGFYFIAPWIDARQNPIWRHPFILVVTKEYLQLALEGRQKGVTIEWQRIRRLDANERVYILYTSSEDNFLIVPRAIFPDAAAEGRFRELLRSKSSLAEAVKKRL